MVSKVQAPTFEDCQNVCPKYLVFPTAVWVDRRSKVPVSWWHEGAKVPVVRRGDEEERQDQRGRDPLAVPGHGPRRERAHAAPTQRAWLELVDAVYDGGGGIRKALRRAWPHARVQRCLLHICLNVGAIPGTNLRHEASRQLPRLTKEPPRCQGRRRHGRLAGRSQREGTVP